MNWFLPVSANGLRLFVLLAVQRHLYFYRPVAAGDYSFGSGSETSAGLDSCLLSLLPKSLNQAEYASRDCLNESDFFERVDILTPLRK